MNRVIVLSILALVAVPIVSGITATDEWERYLNPLGTSGMNHAAAFSTDGDYGIVYDAAGTVRFGISANGTDSFDTYLITTDTPTGLFSIASEGDEWAVVYENATGWNVYYSGDDGATWALKQNTSEDILTADLVALDGSWGLVVAEYVANGKAFYYRTTDDFATWDTNRTEVFDSSQSTYHVAEIAAWEPGKLEIWVFDRAGLWQTTSEDYGAFWSTPTQTALCSGATDPTSISVDVGTSLQRAYIAIQGTGNYECTWHQSGWNAAPSGISNSIPVFIGQLSVVTRGNDGYMLNGGDDKLYQSTAGGAWVEVAGTSLPAFTGYGLALSDNTLAATLLNTDVSNRHEVHVLGLSASPEGDAVLAVDSLQGFSVDTTGETVITRELGTSNLVNTYDASGLTLQGSLDTNCNRINAVAAIKSYEGEVAKDSHVSFINCDGGGSAEYLSIRGADLGDPPGATQEEWCQDFTFGAYCVADLNVAEFEGLVNFTALNDLDAVQELPFDFSQGKHVGIGGTDSAYGAWAFTDINGNAGVVTYVWVDNGDDDVEAATVQVDPAGSVNVNLCSTQDVDGQTYLYAASSGTKLKRYTVEVDLAFQDYNAPEVTITPGSATTSDTAGAEGVACGEGYFAAYTTGGKLTVWEDDGTSPVLTVSGLASPASATFNPLAMNDGGALSAPGGPYVAFVDSSGGVHVYNATAEVFSTTLPSGSFRGVALDGTASNLWVATDEYIVRHEIFSVTTGNNTAYVPDGVTIIGGPTGGGSGGDGGAGSSGVGGGLYGDAIQAASDESGLEVDAIGWILAGVMMIFTAGIMSVPVYQATKKAGLTMIAGGAGLLIGFVMAIATQLLDTFWVTFVIMVVVGVVILVFTLRRGA